MRKSCRRGYKLRNGKCTKTKKLSFTNRSYSWVFAVLGVAVFIFMLFFFRGKIDNKSYSISADQVVLSSCQQLCSSEGFSEYYDFVSKCKPGESKLTYGYAGEDPLLTCCCYNEEETTPSPSPTDTDGDGIPDSSDTDDDNDGFTDSEENEAGTDPLNPNSKPECEGCEITYDECQEYKEILDYQKATIVAEDYDDCKNVADYYCNEYHGGDAEYIDFFDGCCLYSCHIKSCDEWVIEIKGSSYDGFCGSPLPPDGCIDWQGIPGLPLENIQANDWCGGLCCYYADPLTIRYTDEWCNDWCMENDGTPGVRTPDGYSCQQYADEVCAPQYGGYHGMNYCCCYQCL